jgi:hypothetical protein
MSSPKVQSKNAINDPELQTMFNQMVGTSEPDAKIIAPKYETLMDEAIGLVTVLDTVFVNRANVPQGIVSDFAKVFRDLATFVADATTELASLKLEKLAIAAGSQMVPVNQDPANIVNLLAAMERGYDAKKLGENYKALKTCKTMDRLIIAVRDIRTTVEADKRESRTHKALHDLENKDALGDGFITNAAGGTLVLIPSICNMDFVQLWDHPAATKNFKQRVKFALYLFLKKGATIVSTIMSPDVDVEQFSKVLISNIGGLKKQIPRCDKAFKKIENSVGMLKDNFGGYYKDYVVSKNPGIIIESFVMDVAGGSGADAETNRQFKQIIAFYRQKVQGQKKDPQMEKIFDLLGTNMADLERKTGQSYKGSKTSKSSSSGTNPDDSD